jgi:AcrR family transcriptional regulator
MDRRQQKTRAAVYQAFTELLKTKSYSSITIQDIIDEADIGRSTFYSHFETKDDLLNVLCTEIFDHVFSGHLEKETTHNFSKDSNSLEPKLTHILYHLMDNKRYVQGILQGESGEIFMRYFKQHLTEVFEKDIVDVPDFVPKDYYINHLVCGFADTVRWWMSNGGTPEEITGYYCRLYLE